MLNALLACIFAISAVDSPVERKAFNHPIDTAELDRELIELGKRLHAIDDGTQPESAGPMPQVPITDPRFGSDVDPACLAVNEQSRPPVTRAGACRWGVDPNSVVCWQRTADERLRFAHERC